VDGLAIGYQQQPLLVGLSFRLERGQCVALTGPSGCGKTSTLRVLAMLSDPLDGRLCLDEKSPVEWGVPVWRRRVSLVAQRSVFFGNSVMQELAKPYAYHTAEQAFPVALAGQWLARLGLEHHREQLIAVLSEGERQRLALVRSLLLKPRVLLLDEPTSALDPKATTAVEQLLMEQQQETGLSLVLVNHDEEQRIRLQAQEIDVSGLREGMLEKRNDQP
jgi:ABC-type iron transport system FetAB ATPase subunit